MRTTVKLLLGLAAVAALMFPAAGPHADGKTPAPVPAVHAPRLEVSLGQIPLSFIENRGQLDGRAAFYVLGKGESLYFGAGGVTMALTRTLAGPVEAGRWSVKLDFIGADPDVLPSGEGRTETAYSFFKGRQEDWRTGVPAYSRLVYRDLWPGIDLVYSGTADRLKYEFIVRPGADPSAIRLAYTGATAVRLNKSGELEVETPLGGFRDERPLAYQEKNGERVPVPVAFQLDEGEKTAGRGYGFEVGDHDRSLPLILDPATVIYCGFIGSSADDRGHAIAIDTDGSAYVTGFVGYYDFPVTVGPDLSFNNAQGGTDAFVAKVNAEGTGLVYCGYIGGAGNDVGSGIAVDASGNAYVTGWTFSQDFPAFVGPGLSYHGNITQYSDAFVTKVDASGTGLIYSGFVGGTADDLAGGIAVDTSGNAYIAGSTDSSDFPRTGGPDLSHNGSRDAFVAKVNASGTGFVYSGFIGGTAADGAAAVAVDALGHAFVTGYTNSYPGEHFPVRNGPSLTYSGNQDAFVAEVGVDGTSLGYCGYIGGTDVDAGAGIAVDPSGAAYVTGTSNSQFQFPVKVGPELVHLDGNDAFVAKVKSDGSELVYCGFIGGYGNDEGTAVAVDASGIAYVAGVTDSQAGFPVTGGPYALPAGAKDGFLATVSSAGDGLLYCSYLGGTQDDAAMGIAADGLGNVFLAGYTRSDDFPVYVGPFLTPGAGQFGVSDDAFVARIFEDLPPLAPAELHAVTQTTTGIQIAWTDKSSNETGFKIERKSAQSGTWSEVDTVGANVSSYSDTGLAEAKGYNYRVRAHNTVGDSAFSNEILAYTLPAAPTGLAAAVINERRVNLSWTDHSAGESGFRVERRVGAGSWTALNLLAPDVAAYADTTVVEETTYQYRVLAYDAAGDSAPSNTASATTPALSIPLAPSGLQTAALSATEVRVTWVDNAFNEDGYRVERKTGAGGAWAQVATLGPNAGAGWVDTGLSETTTYYYRTRAYNGAGDSGYSNEGSVTTPLNQPIIHLPIADALAGQVNDCAFADATTVLHNDGGASLTVTGITRTSGSGQFSYQGPAAPFTLAPGAGREITVRFSPTATGAASAVFTVVSNDPANPSVTFNASGTGFIPTIGLALQVQRQTERAWIIRREYARIIMTVTKSAPFNVTTYRLSRRTGTGPYQTVKDFSEAEVPGGTLVYNDTFLQSGTSYSYKAEALDCGGNVIATSNEAGTPSPQPPPKQTIRKVIR
jgi:hypothetical protein